MPLQPMQLVLVAAAAGLAACESVSLPATLGTGPLVTASIGEHTEPPVEIYSRIARGALSCWFGTSGSLKKTHVFHADVAPEEAGAGAEITLHERDKAAENPRSVRAFRVVIARVGQGSAVQSENFRLPPVVAKDLSNDVSRWASGRTGCSVVGVGGWDAAPAKEVQAPPAPKKKGR